MKGGGIIYIYVLWIVCWFGAAFDDFHLSFCYCCFVLFLWVFFFEVRVSCDTDIEPNIHSCTCSFDVQCSIDRSVGRSVTTNRNYITFSLFSHHISIRKSRSVCFLYFGSSVFFAIYCFPFIFSVQTHQNKHAVKYI